MFFKMSQSSSPSPSPSHPIGFPNIQMSCWMNSVLQLLIKSNLLTSVFTTISRGKYNVKNDITLCKTLSLFMDSIGPIETASKQGVKAQQGEVVQFLRAYDGVRQTMYSLHPVFQESYLNDAHEVLMFVLNRLHDETSTPVNQALFNQCNVVAKQLLKDFEMKVSPIVQHVAICTEKTCTDGEVRLESHLVLFFESTHETIQHALDSAVIKQSSSLLFLSCMWVPDTSCNINLKVHVRGHEYVLGGLVLFVQGARHYIAAVSGEGEQWFVLDDGRVKGMHVSEMFQMCNGNHPVVFMYQRV